MTRMEARCKYDGRLFVIVERNCETIRIKSDDEEICIHKDEAKPTNKEARELLK